MSYLKLVRPPPRQLGTVPLKTVPPYKGEVAVFERGAVLLLLSCEANGFSMCVSTTLDSLEEVVEKARRMK